jgi:outer membrane protein assembly factor BamD
MRWFLAALLFSLVACETPAPKTALSYTADAKRAYDEAVTEFKAHNWIEAQVLFREVKRKYSYSRFARLAELRIADADFEQEKYAEALREYKAFIHDHRSEADEVAYARAREAESQYREISESFLLAPSEERDQAATLAAHKELADFLKDYPDASESPRICALLEDVTAKLVRHEIYVAKFYLRKDNFEAAVLRAQFAIRSYGTEVRCPTPRATTKKNDEDMPVLEVPDPKPENAFGLIPDALLLLGETYLKMRRPTEARAAFEAILTRYPQSGLVVQAKNHLKALT